MSTHTKWWPRFFGYPTLNRPTWTNISVSKRAINGMVRIFPVAALTLAKNVWNFDSTWFLPMKSTRFLSKTLKCWLNRYLLSLICVPLVSHIFSEDVSRCCHQRYFPIILSKTYPKYVNGFLKNHQWFIMVHIPGINPMIYRWMWVKMEDLGDHRC